MKATYSFWLASAVLAAALGASCSVVNGPDEPLLGVGGGTTVSTDSTTSTTTTTTGNPFGGNHSGGNGTGGTATGGTSPCGDGIVDSDLGETCDPPSTCPTSCDDENPCTSDVLMGEADECTAECVATAISVCADDGCCADGCTAVTDPDCVGCGDGTVVPPETCDGNCPTSCDDQDECTADTMQGSAASCNVVCTNETIVACADGDGCCPVGCHHGVDDDCDAPSVLIVHASGYPPFVQDVQVKQAATGAFSSVVPWDAGATTPTLGDLAPYDVVFVFMDTLWADPIALGNNLADYYDQGGRIVQAIFALTGIGAVGGRFGDLAQGYQLLDITAGQDQPAATLGIVSEPNSPLMIGVSSLQAASAYQSTGALLANTTVVASWSNGGVLVMRGTVNGRPRVDLNMYPASADAEGHYGFWTGDGTALIRNALLFR